MLKHTTIPPGEDLVVRLGRTIRRLRIARGWSQEDLGRRTGLHRNTIGDVERGGINVSIDQLAKIADALGVSATWLLGAEF